MKYLFFLLISSLTINAYSTQKTIQLTNPLKQWVSVGPNKELYVEYYAPETNRPTVVLLHGLTYTTHQWAPFIKELRKFGYGIVCYDMEGMGQTLLRYAPVRAIVPITNQINDLHTLLEKLQIEKPYNIVGLSYGGGVAFGYAVKYPKFVNNLILMAPYTKPVEKINQYILSQVAATRKLNPSNPFTDDQIYEYFFRQFVYTVYPVQEPIILENPYKLEAVFRLSQGVGSFIPAEHVHNLKASTYLMIGEYDQYFPASEYEDFWNSFPIETKKSLFYIKNSEHKIPESQPQQAAQIFKKILK